MHSGLSPIDYLQANGDVTSSGVPAVWGRLGTTAGRPVLRKVRCAQVRKRCLSGELSGQRRYTTRSVVATKRKLPGYAAGNR
jgi:hypothetical protein